MKIDKIFIIMICLISIMFLSSCNRNEKFINEVITQKIEYVDDITIADLDDALALASEKAEASIVGIESSNSLTSGFGSGVIIKCEEISLGYKYYVLTNFHVISYRDKVNSSINVYLSEYNTSITAKHEVSNSDKDIAIISFTSGKALSVATIGDSLKLQKGRFVIAIGNPYDLTTYFKSVSVGNISHPNRQCTDNNNKINYYIQHTAPINSGNSGGGLFDVNGNLIGINTWKYADKEIEGMGFAIPIHIVKELYPKYFK